MKTPYVFAVCGVKNSGKTTLMVKLIRAITEKGLRVASVKCGAHHFQPDVPGTDSFRHRDAGAYGVSIFSGSQFMVVKDGAQTIEGMTAFFPEADIIMLEGARDSEYPKLEVVRSGNSAAPVSDPETMLALVTDLPIHVKGVPAFDINDTAGIVQHVMKAYEEAVTR